jgi:hypothetical protein
VEPQIIDTVLTFVAQPMNRGYINCYPQGRSLCTAYVDGDAARLRTLLTEQVRVPDLLAASL